MRVIRPAIVATATKKNVKCFVRVPPFRNTRHHPDMDESDTKVQLRSYLKRGTLLLWSTGNQLKRFVTICF